MDTPAFVNFEVIREKFQAEQILAAFGIAVDASGNACCPFHKDDTPSLQVNQNWVYCHACKKSWDNYALARALLDKTGKLTAPMVFAWFQTTQFPEPSKTYTRKKAEYIGPVAFSLVEYWHNSLTPELTAQLMQERLFTEETIKKHMLGWRPKKKEWSIPFFRGIRGQSEADIVQFRTTEEDAKVKYYGLAGHNRGSVMNADLLDQDLPFLVVFFGSFDAILARQDGLNAVGLTGSNPFRKDEHDRVHELFGKQHSIFVVPDNTPAEFKPAQQFAELVGGEVRFFNPALPDDTDYISYRKEHNSFITDVLDLAPHTQVPDELTTSLYDLLAGGDPADASKHYLQQQGQGVPARDLAYSLAYNTRPSSLSREQWSTMQKRLWRVRNEEELHDSLALWKELFYTNKGQW